MKSRPREGYPSIELVDGWLSVYTLNSIDYKMYTGEPHFLTGEGLKHRFPPSSLSPFIPLTWWLWTPLGIRYSVETALSLLRNQIVLVTESRISYGSDLRYQRKPTYLRDRESSCCVLTFVLVLLFIELSRDQSSIHLIFKQPPITKGERQIDDGSCHYLQ